MVTLEFLASSLEFPLLSFRPSETPHRETDAADKPERQQ
jgi:hypothetical protein